MYKNHIPPDGPKENTRLLPPQDQCSSINATSDEFIESTVTVESKGTAKDYKECGNSCYEDGQYESAIANYDKAIGLLNTGKKWLNLKALFYSLIPSSIDSAVGALAIVTVIAGIVLAAGAALPLVVAGIIGAASFALSLVPNIMRTKKEFNKEYLAQPDKSLHTEALKWSTAITPYIELPENILKDGVNTIGATAPPLIASSNWPIALTLLLFFASQGFANAVVSLLGLNRVNNLTQQCKEINGELKQLVLCKSFAEQAAHRDQQAMELSDDEQNAFKEQLTKQPQDLKVDQKLNDALNMLSNPYTIPPWYKFWATVKSSAEGILFSLLTASVILTVVGFTGLTAFGIKEVTIKSLLETVMAWGTSALPMWAAASLAVIGGTAFVGGAITGIKRYSTMNKEMEQQINHYNDQNEYLKSFRNTFGIFSKNLEENKLDTEVKQNAPDVFIQNLKKLIALLQKNVKDAAEKLSQSNINKSLKTLKDTKDNPPDSLIRSFIIANKNFADGLENLFDYELYKFELETQQQHTDSEKFIATFKSWLKKIGDAASSPTFISIMFSTMVAISANLLALSWQVIGSFGGLGLFIGATATIANIGMKKISDGLHQEFQKRQKNLAQCGQEVLGNTVTNKIYQEEKMKLSPIQKQKNKKSNKQKSNQPIPKNNTPDLEQPSPISSGNIFQPSDTTKNSGKTKKHSDVRKPQPLGKETT
jgi:tetratricopeptide (TPR) repeat protein